MSNTFFDFFEDRIGDLFKKDDAGSAIVLNHNHPGVFEQFPHIVWSMNEPWINVRCSVRSLLPRQLLADFP
jgi:hypothetical protein